MLQLLSSVSHAWVNQYMQVVGHPDLHGWDGTNPPMIGDIVAAVIREFARGNPGGNSSGRDQDTAMWGGQRAQPAMYSAAHPGPRAIGMGVLPGGGPSGVGQLAVGGQGRTDVNVPGDLSSLAQRQARDARPKASRRQPKHHTPIPAIPNNFDELQGLPILQLSRLLQDDVARQALLSGMTSVVGMKDLRTDVRKGNVETARSTLSKQEIARVLREEGERMRLLLEELQTSYEGAHHGSLSVWAAKLCFLCIHVGRSGNKGLQSEPHVFLGHVERFVATRIKAFVAIHGQGPCIVVLVGTRFTVARV